MRHVKKPRRDQNPGIIGTVTKSCRSDVIAAVLEVCGLESVVLVDDADLETLGIDSLDLIEIGMIMEERHDVQMSSDDFADVTTFGEVVTAHLDVMPLFHDHSDFDQIEEERHDVQMSSDDFADVTTFGEAVAVFDRIITA